MQGLSLPSRPARTRASQRRPRAPAHPLYTATALMWLCGCTTGNIGEPGALGPGLLPHAATNAAAPPHEASQTAPTGDASTPDNCSQMLLAAAAPLSRLTNTEYRNTLRSLLPQLNLPEVPLPDDLTVEGFDNNAKAQTPSAALIEQYSACAEAVGDSVVAQLPTVLPCAADAAADQVGCAAAFVDDFVTRAYRRPLQADERSRYLALFGSANAAYGFDAAIGMLVQAALQSPSFLYRIEPAGEAHDGVAPLDGYAMASRLSYFFWDDMPDQELLDAAGSDALSSTAGIETQARRMLADARARPAVANLFHQWLRFDKMDRMPKSSQLFPEWDDQLAQSLRTGTQRFVERVFWDMNGSLRALLTDTGSFVDERTAPLYGLVDQAQGSAVDASGMTLMNTSADQRSGILTQAGLLAAFAHETMDSPVLRGVFVMDRLLCSAPPPPPPGVTGSISDAPGSGTMTLTTRERFALTHESGTCASCHHTIDGFGFGFSHYDAIGRFRDTDNGKPVDATGWIDNTRDANGPFDGAVQLGQRLAGSTQVSECAAAQWYRYALGLGAADVDSCALAPIAAAFAQSDGSLQELMIAIATSQAFRNRTEVEP